MPEHVKVVGFMLTPSLQRKIRIAVAQGCHKTNSELVITAIERYLAELEKQERIAA